jgi:hypothetical protein
VIVAGRYGSVHPDTGTSYTEMEYRYALESGKPILAFLHENPGEIPSAKCESDPQIKEKLISFRQFCEKKLCKYWSGPADLAAKISRGLTQLTKHEPSAGWIRADEIVEGQELEVLKLREENRVLRDRIKTISRIEADPETLASGTDIFDLNFVCDVQEHRTNKAGNKYWTKSEEVWRAIEVTWDQIFYAIIPALTTTKTQSDAYHCLNSMIRGRIDIEDLAITGDHRIETIRIRSQCGDQIRMQLTALGLVEVEIGDRHQIDWVPTEKGMAKVFALGALKKGETRARDLDDLSSQQGEPVTEPPDGPPQS